MTTLEPAVTLREQLGSIAANAPGLRVTSAASAEYTLALEFESGEKLLVMVTHAAWVTGPEDAAAVSGTRP